MRAWLRLRTRGRPIPASVRRSRSLRAAHSFRRRFRCISVAHNFTPARETIDRRLRAKGYVQRLPYASQADSWYVHQQDVTRGYAAVPSRRANDIECSSECCARPPTAEVGDFADRR
jgi:hypothetical protein